MLNKIFLILILSLSLSQILAQDKLTNEQKLDIIKNHNQAIHLMNDWMRDPYITLTPDGYYYLSCTRQNSDFPSGKASMQFYRSKDLINWEDLGVRWEMKNSNWAQYAKLQKGFNDAPFMIWAPEVHFIDDRWVIVNTSNKRRANLSLTEGRELTGPYVEPFDTTMGSWHDPSIFVDTDGTKWLLASNAVIIKLKDDFSGFDGEAIRIGPSNRKIGHEGCYLIKVKNKYVLFGTGWSTDKMRKGTYNLYYCTADKITGPYNKRKFAGRFLGHGTPFKDKEGRWWCTAFYNANKPALKPEKAAQMDLSDTAYTINKQGLTIVPLSITLKNGDVYVKALDVNYALPGNEEIQKFK